MKIYFYVFVAMGALIANSPFAQEEVIVTSSYIDQTLSEIENPLHVVSGDDISANASQSLGETLDSLLGIASSDYGAAVGQPVIRGMSGNRVKILENGLVVRDVSGLGADHINDIDLNNVQQIEIIRGPSSLLYSNGAIGGIINIVDNTITKKDFEGIVFKSGLESQSVNNGNTKDFIYQGNLSGLNVSVGLKDSEFGNFDIPDGAVIHREDENGDDDDDEDLGYLPDSDFESTAQKIGLSKTGDWGYFGVSLNNIRSLYGIPFHEEAESGDQGNGGGNNNNDDDDHHEEERIFSTTDSDVFNLEGSYVFQNGWLNKLNYFFRNTDYSLTEQHEEEEEEEHEEDDHDDGSSDGHSEEEGHEEPTVFKNNSEEYNAVFDFSNESLSQKLAFNFADEDVSIIGDEAFMEPAKNKEITFGYYFSKDLSLFHLDFGIRHDQISKKGSVTNHTTDEQGQETEETEHFNIDFNSTSFALSLGKELLDSFDVSLGFASVERAPSVVALFIDGDHLATGRHENGNPNLDAERSNNIDITFDYENSGFYGSLSLFRNDVDNYIYLSDTNLKENGLRVANYVQKDAELYGAEFEVGKIFDLARGSLSMSFGRDFVSGEFADKSNIPRIVPDRNIYTVSYQEDGFKATVTLMDVMKQNDTAMHEDPTDGYEMLNVNLTKSFKLSANADLTLSIFGNNLLDEVARNHTSFVKDEVPLPGRNYGIKFNVRLQ